MKIVLIALTSLFITQVAFAQLKTVVFKVRKAPAPKTSSPKIVAQEDALFVIVEQPATFQRGDLSNFKVWVMKNLKYPPIAVENNISGTVYVQFVVNPKGIVERATVLRGADPSLNEEALRVISSSPKWDAAKQGGRNVSQVFTLPINFNLQPQ